MTVFYVVLRNDIVVASLDARARKDSTYKLIMIEIMYVYCASYAREQMESIALDSWQFFFQIQSVSGHKIFKKPALPSQGNVF